MPRLRLLLHLVALLVVAFSFSETSHAKARVMTIGEGIVVYSGPGKFYRPIAILPAKQTLRSSSKMVTSRDGSYYRVLVQVTDKTRSIGFISSDANVRLVDDQLGEDDLEKFGEIALLRRAVQGSYSVLRDGDSLWTLGYVHYLGPGFYVKGFGGQFSSAKASSGASLLGGEVGNDALLFGRMSGLVSYSLGVFAPNEAGKIFEGSQSVNAFMQGAFGLRYNLAGVASVSAAVNQNVFFNANNSFVTSGFMFSLEVGI